MEETPCMICQNNLAKHKCRMCGVMVCEDHYNQEKNLCSNCNQGQQ